MQRGPNSCSGGRLEYSCSTQAPAARDFWDDLNNFRLKVEIVEFHSINIKSFEISMLMHHVEIYYRTRKLNHPDISNGLVVYFHIFWL